MSWWGHLLVFVLALPISVWLWATFMGMFDNADKTKSLLRFMASLVAVLGLIVAVDRDAVISFGVALGIVIVLHIASFWALRKFLIGIDTDG